MISEREVKAKEIGEKWEKWAFETIKKIVSDWGIKYELYLEDGGWYDIRLVAGGFNFFVEVKHININTRQVIYGNKKKYYKRKGILKIIRKNHEILLKNNGMYFIILHNKKIKSLWIMAKTIDKIISHDREGKYYGISVKKLIKLYDALNIFNEKFREY